MFLVFATTGVATMAGPIIYQIASFVITFVNGMILLPGPLGKHFELVMRKEMNYGSDMLFEYTLKRPPSGYVGETAWGTCVRRIRIVTAPERWVIRNLIYFGLSFIPFVGPVIVILLEAPRRGFKCHKRYFTLKGYDNAQCYYYWDRHFWDYFAFGVISLSLEQIPYLTYLFAFTNATGGALWAVDMERSKLREVISSHEPLDLSSKKSLE